MNNYLSDESEDFEENMIDETQFNSSRPITKETSTDNETHHKTEENLPPVIFSLNGKLNSFRSLNKEELERAAEDFIKTVGEVKHSKLAKGGDIFIYAKNKEQLESLLKITKIAGKPVSTSTPNYITKFIGIINNVDLDYTEEQLNSALSRFNVISAVRLKTKNENGILINTDKVKLFFASQLPERVMIAFDSFPVKKYIHSPFLCNNCLRIGHTQKGCPSNTKACQNCGKSHEANYQCQKYCINCGSNNHISTYKACPRYITTKRLINKAFDEGTSIKAAIQKAFSQSLHFENDWSNHTEDNLSNPGNTIFYQSSKQNNSTTDDVITTINKLRKEVSEIKNKIIPDIQDEIQQLKEDFENPFKAMQNDVKEVKNDIASILALLAGSRINSAEEPPMNGNENEPMDTETSRNIKRSSRIAELDPPNYKAIASGSLSSSKNKKEAPPKKK